MERKFLLGNELMNRFLTWSVVVFCCLLIAGCSDSFGGDSEDEYTPDPPVEEEECQGMSLMPFNPRPAVMLLPWPTDLFSVEDSGTHTGRRIMIGDVHPPIVDKLMQEVSFVKEALNSADGFSTTSRIFVPISGEVWAATLPDLAGSAAAGASVQLIVSDENSDHYGERILCDVVYRPQLGHIQIKPLLPLDGSTRHMVVVTKDLLDVEADPVCSSEEFLYLKKTEPDDSVKYFEDLEPVRQSYQPIFEFLETQEVPLDRSRVAVAFEFTTTEATKDMELVSQYILDRAETYPPEAVDLDVYPASHAELSVEMTGSFPSPNFRDEEGVFLFDTERMTPYSNEDEWLEFLMVLPESEGGVAQQPFPVVLFMHGIESRKTQMRGMRSVLARNGYAGFAIDAVEHGTRSKENFIPDSLHFLRFLEPPVMRDNIRQTVADNLQAVQFIKTLTDLDVYPYNPETEEYGDGIPDLDTDNVMLCGHSLGGIMGLLVLALSPDIQAYVGVPASGQWTDVAEYTIYGEVLISVVRLFREDFTYPEPLLLLYDLINTIFEPADNFNYIRHATLDPLPVGGSVKNVLLQEAIGDPTLPNSSTNLLAFTGGIPLLSPYVEIVGGLEIQPSPVASNGLFQYPTFDHSFFLHSDEYSQAAHFQAGVFYESYLQTGQALIIDPNDPSQVPSWMSP